MTASLFGVMLPAQVSLDGYVFHVDPFQSAMWRIRRQCIRLLALSDGDAIRTSKQIDECSTTSTKAGASSNHDVPSPWSCMVSGMMAQPNCTRRGGNHGIHLSAVSLPPVPKSVRLSGDKRSATAAEALGRGFYIPSVVLTMRDNTTPGARRTPSSSGYAYPFQGLGFEDCSTTFPWTSCKSSRHGLSTKGATREHVQRHGARDTNGPRP